MLTKEDVDTFLEMQERIEVEAKKALQWYNENIKVVPGIDFLETESIDFADIFFEGTERWAYGGYENYSFSLETKILYDEDYRNSLKQKQEEKVRLQNKEIKIIKQEELKKEKETRFKLYQELKKEFEK